MFWEVLLVCIFERVCIRLITLTIEKHGKLEALDAANLFSVIEAKVLSAESNLNLAQVRLVLFHVHFSFAGIGFLARLAQAIISEYNDILLFSGSFHLCQLYFLLLK